MSVTPSFVRLNLAFLVLLFLAACDAGGQRAVEPLPADARVLVVGDSLVAGTGASSAQSWPAVLAEHTGWAVINAGVPGDTSAEARERLLDLLVAHQPDAVIIAIGGNDFLRRLGTETTRANIDAMVADSKTHAAHVAILGIPAPSVGGALIGRLTDHELYAHVAREQGVALVPEAVSRTLSRETFRADRIHANAAGYAFLAQQVVESLTEQGWLAR